jgi:aspartate 1-decarboxylase
MLREFLKSKIHRLTVTDANIDYVGSITIDRSLLETADIAENEKVLVVNINNGQRFETYAISGEADSGVVCLNGAAARLANVGDIVIVMTFGLLEQKEIEAHKPKIVLVDKQNKSQN